MDVTQKKIAKKLQNHLGGNKDMSKTTDKDGVRARFVTYNVLSSSLCAPSWYPKCPAEDLDPNNRWGRVLAKLSAHGVKKDAIIGTRTSSLHRIVENTSSFVYVPDVAIDEN